MTTAFDHKQRDYARHLQKMQARQAAHKKKIASKPILRKGLLLVYSGPGKGKSTAAFGLMLRGLGCGWKVGVVQFIKGAWRTGERAIVEARLADLVFWHTMGEGFSWDIQDRDRDIAAAERAWEIVKKLMDNPEIKLLILDELNLTLAYKNLSTSMVLETLLARRDDLHIVITGRGASQELIEVADTVTTMGSLKHHFANGVRGQEGIEW